MSVLINDINFPDAIFREYIKTQIIKDSSATELTDDIIAQTKQITSSSDVSDLTGIKYFQSLTTLNCYRTNLTVLDVSGMSALEVIRCANSQLQTLKISDCPALTTLNCSTNQLTEIDFSGCAALSSVECNYNQLNELDFSECPNLTGVACVGNQLTVINVSGCPKLKSLNCFNNKLNTLDLSNNALLSNLVCNDNQLTTLNVSGGKYLGATGYRFNCSNNQLTTLDVSDCEATLRFDCSNNHLTELNINSMSGLLEFNCSGNQLTKINVGACTAITSLNCSNNNLEELDVSSCTLLETLDCGNNNLEELDVSSCTLLETLDCSNNNLKELDLQELAGIKNIMCQNNIISKIIFHNKGASITRYVCYNNAILGNLFATNTGYAISNTGDFNVSPQIATVEFVVEKINDATYPYQIKLAPYIILPKYLQEILRVIDKNGNSIDFKYYNESGTLRVAAQPVKIQFIHKMYYYSVKNNIQSISECKVNYTMVLSDPIILTETLPVSFRGTPYNLQLQAIERTPITWSIIDGELPQGLTLDSETGVISGTPILD